MRKSPPEPHPNFPIYWQHLRSVQWLQWHSCDTTFGDTLPGVAISISLVPPLNVVGLALSIKKFDHALGAFLLFATNMASILFMGVIAMFVYRVHDELDEKKGSVLPGAPRGLSSSVWLSKQQFRSRLP